MTMCFYSTNFNGVSDNFDLKRITSFKMSDIRRVEPLKSWRVKHRFNSLIFLSVVKCVFYGHHATNMEEEIAICFNVLSS